MSDKNYLITEGRSFSVMKPGTGRIKKFVEPKEAICDENGRILAFRVQFDDGGYRDFILLPKKSPTYDALKFVEKVAAVFAVGWVAANHYPSVGQQIQQAGKAWKFLDKHSAIDNALDFIHDFIGVREWGYYDADDLSIGIVLEGPIMLNL
jgi:hypothetical protein